MRISSLQIINFIKTQSAFMGLLPSSHTLEGGLCWRRGKRVGGSSGPSGVVRGDQMKEGAVCVRDKWMDGCRTRSLMSRLQQAHLKDNQCLILSFVFSWSISVNSLDSWPLPPPINTVTHIHIAQISEPHTTLIQTTCSV